MNRMLVLVGMLGCDTRMIDQPKVLPYDEPMRTPPAGTISREAAAAPTTAPPTTRGLVERGRDRYAIVCTPCHGTDGTSDTPVARHMILRPPPSLREPRIFTQPPADTYRVITEGYGLMPAYAALLSPDDRWAIVAYLHTL